jgi:membrane protease YdiL (CAAX protease family)
MVIQWVYRNWKKLVWLAFVCLISLGWILSTEILIMKIIKAYPIPHVSGKYYIGFLRPLFTLSLLFIFVSLMSKVSHKRSLSGYGLNKKIDKRSLVLAILLGLLFGGLSILADFIQPSEITDTYNLYKENSSLVSIILFTITVGLCTGINEETLFRGFLNTELTKLWDNSIWKVNLAWIASSFFFVLIHIGNFLHRGEAFICFYALAIFSFGLALSYLKEKSGGLMAPIIAHAVANSFEFVFIAAWMGF